MTEAEFFGYSISDSDYNVLEILSASIDPNPNLVLVTST